MRLGKEDEGMEGRGGLVGKRELHEIVAQLLLNGNRVSQAKTPALILSSPSFESFIHSSRNLD